MASIFRSRLGRRYDIKEMRQAFNVVFRHPAGVNYVLPDFVEFCHAAEPAPRGSDLFVQGRAAGRRDVWLHVAEYLHLTEDELFALYQNRSILKHEGT